MATPAAETQSGAVVGDSVIDLGTSVAVEFADDEALTPAVPAMLQDAANNVTRSGLAPAGTAKATLEIPKATALPAGFDDAPSSMISLEASVRPYAATMISTPTPASPMVEAVAVAAVLAQPAPHMAPTAYIAPAVQVSKVQPAATGSSNKKFVALAIGLLAVGGAFAMMSRSAALVAPVAAVPVAVVAPVAAPQAQQVAPMVAEVAPAVEAPVAAVAPKAGASKGVAVAPVAAAAPAAVEAPKAVVAPPAPVAAGDLAGAINRAAGPVKSAGDVTAESGEDRANVPQRPSQGAMTGALRPNIAAASKCLGDGDGDSRATIVFESTGKAQSVSVSGPAAGTPAEACITKALMKTKIGPFADATYSTPVTIRH